MKHNEEKLKPCPFCGGKAKYSIADDEEHNGGEFIECVKCGASTNLTMPLMDDVKDIVIEKWNNRVLPPLTHKGELR